MQTRGRASLRPLTYSREAAGAPPALLPEASRSASGSPWWVDEARNRQPSLPRRSLLSQDGGKDKRLASLRESAWTARSWGRAFGSCLLALGRRSQRTLLRGASALTAGGSAPGPRSCSGAQPPVKREILRRILLVLIGNSAEPPVRRHQQSTARPISDCGLRIYRHASREAPESPRSRQYSSAQRRHLGLGNGGRRAEHSLKRCCNEQPPGIALPILRATPRGTRPLDVGDG